MDANETLVLQMSTSAQLPDPAHDMKIVAKEHEPRKLFYWMTNWYISSLTAFGLEA